MQVLITIALIVIGVLLFEFIIFAHEFGHFITAKRSGVQVNEFALGMGPKLFSFKKGETTYSLRLFPIGGYCAMEGEDEESKNPRAFTNAKVWKRMIIIVAGAVMNIIAGFILVFVLTINQAEFYSTTVKGFTPVSFTEMSGLQKGDKIVNVGGYSVGNSKDLLMGIQLLPCETVDSDSLGVYKEQACLSAKTCLEKLYSDEKMYYDTAMDIYTDTFSEQTRKLYAAGDEKTAEEIYRETVDKIYSEAKVDKPKDFEYPEVEISEKTERFVGDVEVVRDGRNVTLRNVHFYTAVNQKGKTVVPGGTFDCSTRNRDIAAIALFALGVPKPVYMTARVQVRRSCEPRLSNGDDNTVVLTLRQFRLILFLTEEAASAASILINTDLFDYPAASL